MRAKGLNVHMLCNMEHLHRANVFLAVAIGLHSVYICRCRLACPNDFVFVHVEDHPR